IIAFSLSLLGTFLVRSGVLTSVHAFAIDPARGVFVLLFLAIVVGGSLALFAWRAGAVGGGAAFAPVSRESMLLANNVLLVVAMASVLLGTLYPLMIDALHAGKISVGPPYFQSVFYPLIAPLVFLMGLGPVATWRKAELPAIWTRVRWAFAVALVNALLLPFTLGSWKPLVAFALFLALWVVTTTVAMVVQRFRASPQRGLLAKFAANTAAWYGMLVAHLGIAVFIVGVTLVSGYGVERDVRLDIGQGVDVGGYTFTFRGVEPAPGPNYHALIGTIDVSRNGKLVRTLKPEKRVFNASGQTMTEAAIATRITGDLYVSLGEPVAENGAWGTRVYIKPFVDWIWFGAFIMALGGFIAVSDRRYRIAVAARVSAVMRNAAA
ncbi:MAG: cytochrome c-type biogenesis CcmF C-terminal domain-containing protein, partial [Casimicrobiaceae bacterium]